jgi:hypothetical protein
MLVVGHKTAYDRREPLAAPDHEPAPFRDDARPNVWPESARNFNLCRRPELVKSSA